MLDAVMNVPAAADAVAHAHLHLAPDSVASSGGGASAAGGSSGGGDKAAVAPAEAAAPAAALPQTAAALVAQMRVRVARSPHPGQLPDALHYTNNKGWHGTPQL